MSSHPSSKTTAFPLTTTMDRRQRREAERRAKKSDNLNAPQLSLVPAATASAAREGCIFGARIDPASHAQFRKLLRSIHVAPDGLGADLLYLTAEFARISSFYAVSTTYAMVKLQRRHFWRIPGVEAQISQDIKKMKSSWRKRGTMCNYCRAERNSEEGAAKRCMRVRVSCAYRYTHYLQYCFIAVYASHLL